jgi:hypothetical protein
VQSFGVGVSFEDADRLCALAETTEDALTVGSVSFDGFVPPGRDQGTLDAMEDPLAECARRLLSGIVYPGDNPEDPKVLEPGRFFLYQVSDEEHVIWDSACYLEPDLTIASVLLLNPLFTIDGWYWRHRGIARGIAKRTLRQTERARKVHTGTMGDALADRAVEVLSDRMVYPLDIVFESPV